MLLRINNSDTVDKLTDNFGLMLKNQLESRAGTIDENINSAIEPLKHSAAQLALEASTILQENDAVIDDDGSFKMIHKISSELNDLAAQHVIDLARLRGVDGAYLVWNTYPIYGSNLADGIEIRDVEARITQPDNSDLRLQIGPSTLVYDHGVTLDRVWSRYYKLDDKSSYRSSVYDSEYSVQMLEQLYGYENSHSPLNIQNQLSYWSDPFLSNDADDMIIYTVPLIDQSMRVIGLCGLKIDPKAILSALPARDPAYQNSSFIVGVRDGDGSIHIDPRLAKSQARQLFQPFEDEDGLLKLDLSASRYDGFVQAEIIGHEGAQALEPYLLTVRPLESIVSSNLSDRRQWVLIELVDKAEFNNPVSELKNQLLIVVIGAMIIAGFGAFAAGTSLARPLIILSKQLLKQQVEDEIKLPRFKITELDHLSVSIEQMSRRLKESTFKTASIIDLLDLPIASFEEQPENDLVIISSAMREILDLNMDSKLQTSLDMNTWNSIIAHLLSSQESGYEDVYRWHPGKGKRDKWLRIRQAENDGRVSGIIIDISEEILKHRRLVKELDYDDLTKLYNRQAFIQRVDEILEDSHSSDFAVMLFVDLDNLKEINDTYGHQFGDQYLQLAASFMSRFRADGGLAARFAGDEFAAFTSMAESREEAVEKCNKILELLPEQLIRLPDNKMSSLSISIGAVVYPIDAVSAKELLEYADFAMYQRKHSGKNGLTWFDRKVFDINKKALKRRADLDELLTEGLIEYAAQAIANADTAEIVGFDLRLRPIHPHITLPLDLIRIATEEGRLSQLEALMMEKASLWVEENMSQYPEAKVFVHLFETVSCRYANNATLENSITVDNREQGSWRHLAHAGFDETYFQNLTGKIVFVMDVSGAVPAEIIACCRERCKKYNSSLAITGLANFDDNRVIFKHQLPQYVIFDLSMVRDIPTDDGRQELLSLMIEHCHSLGIKAVASGISSADELRTVTNLGADYVQGYYLGKPNKTASRLTEEAVRILRVK